jgi:hypothetical protein
VDHGVNRDHASSSNDNDNGDNGDNMDIIGELVLLGGEGGKVQLS